MECKYAMFHGRLNTFSSKFSSVRRVRLKDSALSKSTLIDGQNLAREAERSSFNRRLSMENQETNEQSSQRREKWELKENLKPDQIKSLLREWLNALEENRDLEVMIKGENCRVPKEALLQGRTQAEFECKKGEYELELELKWRESDLTH